MCGGGLRWVTTGFRLGGLRRLHLPLDTHLTYQQRAAVDLLQAEGRHADLPVIHAVVAAHHHRADVRVWDLQLAELR